MELVYFLLPAAVFLAFIGLIGFVWAVRSGQFKDLETPARRILFDKEKLNYGSTEILGGDKNGSK